jgi:NTE family protein
MQFFRLAVLGLMLLCTPSTDVFADNSSRQPKIGLALSGGGARGGAHVGVLKALEELGVEVDYIAGTSMGAIVGGLYASGYSAHEIEEILIGTDWKKAMTDRAARRDRTMRKKELEAQFLIPYRIGFNNGKFQMPLGAVEGQHLDQLFHEMLLPVVGVHDFNQLPIPFRAVATDLVSGEAVALSHGSLPDALRASMSVPGVFAPVRIDGKILVDGGMSNNLPVDVVRQMGADVVIAVDISSPLLKEEQLTSILSVSEQLTNFLTRKNADAQIESLGPQDFLIVPDLGKFSSANFQKASDVVPIGYEATLLQTDRLAEFSGPHSQEPGRMALGKAAPYTVQFIEIDNSSVLNDELIHSRLAVEIGQPLDLETLNDSVDMIYSLDVFESVTYDFITDEQDRQGLVIHAKPRDWGPNYFQFGMELASDFSGSSDFRLGAAYTRNALNSLGGELRVVGSIGIEDEISFDFYQPIDMKAKWFVEPQVYAKRQNYNLWDDSTNIATLEISGWGTMLGMGRNLSTTDRLRLDYGFGRGKAKTITGDLGFPFDDRVKIGELRFRYQHDSLDSLWFPTSGMAHMLEYLHASDSLGASGNYQQALADGLLSISGGKNTWSLHYEAGYSFDDKAPIERWFRLGGLGRLSGLVPEQLSGRQSALASLAYYRLLNDFDLLQTYAGFTLEAGNVWDSTDDVGFDDLRYSASVYFGAVTPIGPIYVAYGHSDSGDNAVYFYLGNPFRVRRFD